MSNITLIEQDQTALDELYDTLEARYGAEIAQEIVGTIKATIKEGKTPDYMLVKALSEMVEQFAGEAHALRAELRQKRAKWNGTEVNVTSIELCRLEADFRQIRRIWWISLNLYRPLYNEALRAARVSRYPARPSVTNPRETALAA